MDYTVLQARILEWAAFPFSRASSQPRDQTQGSHTAGRFFTNWAMREVWYYCKPCCGKLFVKHSRHRFSSKPQKSLGNRPYYISHLGNEETGSEKVTIYVTWRGQSGSKTFNLSSYIWVLKVPNCPKIPNCPKFLWYSHCGWAGVERGRQKSHHILGLLR